MGDLSVDTEEMRLYLVILAPAIGSRSDLATAAIRATWGSLKAAAAAAPERYAGYGASLQPKIAVRVKSEAHLRRCLAECVSAGLPAALVESDRGLPVAVGIGPTTRSELPPFVRDLQLLSDAIADPSAPEPPVAPSKFWLLVREDADIPFGKLAPQAGHGFWGAVREAHAADDRRLREWDENGSVVDTRSVRDLDEMRQAFEAATRCGLAASFIVDAGRTVYAGKPTPTVVGIGPCPEFDVPGWLRALPPIHGVEPSVEGGGS